MTYHHVGHLGDGRVFGRHAADVSAVPEDCHTVRQGLYFVHLMGDDDNGLAVVPHFPEDTEQLFGLLGRQHSGGLVQNQNIRAAVQYLYNLHGLLLGYRHIINLLLRVYLEAIFLTDRLDFLRSLFDIQLSLQTQDNVLCGGKHVDQLEMLMHHADTKIQGVLRGLDDLFLSIDKDLALIRIIDTGQHIHQRGFSASVFAQKRQDFALVDIQIYLFIGNYRAKGLCNVFH